jgi:hypothetical protein
MSREAFIREIEAFQIKEPFSFTASYHGPESVKIVMYRARDDVAYLICYTDGTQMWFETGRTLAQYRQLGYGTWIRAAAAWCAKRAGYKRLFQTSTRLTNTPGTRRPTSAYIMNKLGFNHYNNNTNNINSNMSNNNREHRVLNLVQNIPRVNAVVRNIRR